MDADMRQSKPESATNELDEAAQFEKMMGSLMGGMGGGEGDG